MEYFSQSFDNALSRTIAEKLLENILSGELRPGDKVVESVYADQFNTSRSPVREAIYLLSTEGLIERVPRKGAFIKGYTIDDVRDLLDIRNHLEMLAADRIQDPHKQKTLLEEMKLVLKKMESCKSQIDYTHANYEFHFILVKFSGSPVLIEMYSKIALPLLRIQVIHFSRERMIEKSIDEHKAIYELLKNNGLDELKTILRKHTEDVIHSVRKQLL